MYNYNEVADNPLKSRKDFQDAVRQLCEPLKKYYSDGCARLHIGSTGALCIESTARMEAFARPLWGLVPFAAGGGESDLWNVYINGIRNGTNPDHEEYWGQIGDKDQLMVEMAVLGLALCMTPEKVWSPLSVEEKKNMQEWLYQINNYVVVDTNWLFFRVLVNLGLKKAGAEYDSGMIERDLNRLDEFYIADGWYQDGISDQRDYYVPFAMHFYGLIYAKLTGDEDKPRAERYRKRAESFAKDFIYWFSSDGSSVPFGRSLTYRFAQSAFWSALAFADLEVMPWGVIKGIVCRNLRWWFKQPIFSSDGVLTIGYAYPNLNMAEGYNAPGSPYWALKTFLVLALGEEHPFWQAEEEELPELKDKSMQKHPYMIVCRHEKGKHVVALTSGQHAGFEPVHGAAKYEKFAYSSIFGFSVPRGDYGLEQGSYDSMLALSEGDNLYRVRRKCEEVKVEEEYIYSRWKPWKDVEVRTWLVPCRDWYIRMHIIDTGRSLDTAEGGFAITREQGMKQPGEKSIVSGENIAMINCEWGMSGIINLEGVRKGEIIRAETNSNLINPRTWIPTLKGQVEPGRHLLVSAVIGMTEKVDQEVMVIPTVKLHANSVVIKYGDSSKIIEF